MLFNLHGKTQYVKLHLGFWGFVIKQYISIFLIFRT